MGNGVQGYGVYEQWGTGGMGHIGNGSHGQWGTWVMGQWGLWAMGSMGDWDIFAHSIITTGWILTKILLDIDIDVFYLTTPRFLHDGLN